VRMKRLLPIQVAGTHSADKHISPCRPNAPDGRRIVLCILIPVLDRPQAVLDQFKHHVVQVAGHVGKGEGRVPIDADVRGAAILAQADGARVIDGILRHLYRGALGADEADVVGLAGLVQRYVLACGSGSSRDSEDSGLVRRLRCGRDILHGEPSAA
jgi:hypothetical protein